VTLEIGHARQTRVFCLVRRGFAVFLADEFATIAEELLQHFLIHCKTDFAKLLTGVA